MNGPTFLENSLNEQNVLFLLKSTFHIRKNRVPNAVYTCLGKGSFNNYVDRICHFLTPLRGQFCYSKSGQKQTFF